MNGNDSNEEKKESMTMVVVRQVTNNKKKKKKHNNGSSCKSFDIGSLFSIPIVVCTQQQQKQQTNTTTTTTTDKSWTVIDVPSNCLLTLTTACTNKLANVCLYVAAATADDEFVCIGSLTKQKAMTNIGIQVTSTSIKVKAEQTHTIFRNNTINSSTVPLAVNLFGTIQPTSTSSTAYSLKNQSTKDNNINNNHITATTTTTKISTDDEANTTTTTNTTPGSKKSDNDGNDNSESKRVSKKRKLSEDVDIKDNNNVTSENGEDPPIQKLTKKQRKKLAKQKALELEKALHGNPDEKKQQQKQKPSPTKKTKISPLTKERRLEGGLLVRDIILGTGSMAVKPGKKVSIHYEASLADTDQVFDRNQSKSNPLSFRVGTGQVIKGLERGLQGMRAGGERMLTIPPDLGYGKKGSGNVIPKNATLCFTVKLINVGGSGK